MTTNNSLTQYNFILDCKRRSCVKPSARRRHRAKPELAFISSWADKQRHWDQVRKGWSPQIWKSNVGKRGSACWWLRCTLCWAWLPSLRQSSVLAPWFPDLSEWFALKWQRASLRNSCTFSPSSARSVISCWSQTPWRDSAFWYPNSKSRPGGAAPLCPWVMFKVPHHTITSSIRFCTVWIHNCTVPKCGFYSALSRLHFTTTSRGVIKCTISLIFKAVRTIFLPPPPPHCAHSLTHYSIWCNYIKSTEKKGPHSKKTFLQTNSFEEIQELLNQELTSFCSRACPANRQPSRVKCCLRAPSGGTQTPTPPCLPTGGLWGFFPPHFSLFASGDSGTGITDSTTILSYLLALSKKFSSFEETIYNNGENPRTGCVGGGPRDSPAPTIPTTGCYLGQSQAAVSHLLMQRRDPAWSASLRSGCSLSAVFYPAWLTVLTSTPPYPSHFPCTSAVPVGAMRINVIPVGVTDEMYWEVFPFPTARHWAWY